MTVKWFASSVRGTGSGSSASNAMLTTALQTQHDAGASGDDFRIVADNTACPLPTATLNWTKKISIGGYKTDGTTRAYAIFAKGDRTHHWPLNGTWTDSGRYTAANAGTNFMNYKDAAAATGGTTFDYLSFRDIGTPFRPNFTSSAVLGKITVSHIKTWNTNGLVYVESSSDGQCSITADHCTSVGYSKGMFRAFGDMFLDWCRGDAQSQFHAPGVNLFGAHVQDAVAGVTLVKYQAYARNCIFLNHNAAPPAGSSLDPETTGNYMQGDGIVWEENTTVLESYNIVVKNNADRGIDGKPEIKYRMLHDVYGRDNGYDFAAHDDLVETWITDSYLGSTLRASFDTRKSAPIQASGHLNAARCVIEQGQLNATTYVGVAYGTVQPEHVQSGVTVPQRTGALKVFNCIIRYTSGLAESVLSSGGSPVTTPTYTRDDGSQVTVVSSAAVTINDNGNGTTTLNNVTIPATLDFTTTIDSAGFISMTNNGNATTTLVV